MRSCFLSLFTFSLLIFEFARADNKCPDFPILHENYPVKSIIISDFSGLGDSKFFPAYLKILGENLKGTDIDLILVGPARAKSKALANLPKEAHKNLVHVEGASYLWHQDYLIPTLDLNRKLKIRLIQDYGKQRRESGANFDEKSAQRLVRVLGARGISIGEDIVPGERFAPGNMGGNVIGLPGDICAIGSSSFKHLADWTKFSTQVCGDLNNVISAPTEIATANHSDELIKIIPNKNQAPPCNFSVALADLSLPLELLKENADKSFFEVEGRTDWASHPTLVEKFKGSAMASFCKNLYDFDKILETPTSPKQITPGGGVSFFKFEILFFPKAMAGEDSIFINYCSGIKNSDVYKYFHTPIPDSAMPVIGEPDQKLTSIFELQIRPNQKKLEIFRQNLFEKLKDRLPQCKIDIVSLPMMAHLPYAANAVTIGNTVITPDSGKKIFNSYISDEYKKRGIEARFIDTTSAHILKGNLHCLTKVINRCN